MRAALLSLSKHLCAAETIPPRVNWPKALAAVVAPHIAALVTIGWIERNAFALGLALLTWCFLNGVWLALLRRPALAAALSLIMIEALIVLSQFKISIQEMSVSFFDFLVVDADTISFLLMIFPVLRMGLIVGALVAAPLLVLLWRLDPFRVPRRSAMMLTMAGLAGIVGLGSAVPDHAVGTFRERQLRLQFHPLGRAVDVRADQPRLARQPPARWPTRRQRRRPQPANPRPGRPA